MFHLFLLAQLPENKIPVIFQKKREKSIFETQLWSKKTTNAANVFFLNKINKYVLIKERLF